MNQYLCWMGEEYQDDPDTKGRSINGCIAEDAAKDFASLQDSENGSPFIADSGKSFKIRVRSPSRVVSWFTVSGHSDTHYDYDVETIEEPGS